MKLEKYLVVYVLVQSLRLWSILCSVLLLGRVDKIKVQEYRGFLFWQFPPILIGNEDRFSFWCAA